jgi:DNA repair exonuclease SbcCD ATPase subunit
MNPEINDSERLHRLEQKDEALEKELKKLEEEEKELNEKIKKLTLKEMKLAKWVSELDNVNKKRPNFLINYTESKDKGGLVAELKPSSRVEMDVSEGRKKLLEANIKKVLKKQERVKEEVIRREKELESQTPVRDLRMNNKMHDTFRLFRVLLAKGTLTLDEAREQLNVDLDTVRGWAKDLENSGIVEVNTPLYGSPTLKLKTLPTGMKKLKR